LQRDDLSPVFLAVGAHAEPMASGIGDEDIEMQLQKGKLA
jgi:hypothetical protein